MLRATINALIQSKKSVDHAEYSGEYTGATGT
jgi:hypothetical protein